jgi:hypothetical protein
MVFIQREAYLKKGLGKRRTTRRSRAPISRQPMLDICYANRIEYVG